MTDEQSLEQDPHAGEPDPVDRILKALRLVGAATIFLFVLIFGVVGYLAWDAQVEREDLEKVAHEVAEVAISTNEALCAVRLNFEQRIESSEEFLREHPEGFAGVSAEEIIRSINEEKQTLRALSGIDCPESEVPEVATP